MAQESRRDEEKLEEKEKEQTPEAVVSVLVDDTSERLVHSKEEERRLVRKLDLRLMPILCIMYLCACKFMILTSFPERQSN